MGVPPEADSERGCGVQEPAPVERSGRKQVWAQGESSWDAARPQCQPPSHTPQGPGAPVALRVGLLQSEGVRRLYPPWALDRFLNGATEEGAWPKPGAPCSPGTLKGRSLKSVATAPLAPWDLLPFR